MGWPDFIVIGAEKSATTWLYERLKEHPEIFMPESKELHFFNALNSRLKNNPPKREEWYLKQFEGSEGRIKGEVTPMYLCDTEAPGRIKKLLPRVKLIAILRNPIDRAYSHYWMFVNKGFEKDSFNQVLEQFKEPYFRRGKYYEQLSRYYELFDSEQILVLLKEDIDNSPDQVLKTIYAFLNVDVNYKSDNLFNKANKSKTYKSKFLYHFFRITTHFLNHKMRMAWFVQFIKRTGFNQKFKKWNTKSFKYEALSSEHRKILLDYYRNDIKQLERLINRDLSSWLR